VSLVVVVVVVVVVIVVQLLLTSELLLLLHCRSSRILKIIPSWHAIVVVGRLGSGLS
jgi:hypothetical protein